MERHAGHNGTYKHACGVYINEAKRGDGNYIPIHFLRFFGLTLLSVRLHHRLWTLDNNKDDGCLGAAGAIDRDWGRKEGIWMDWMAARRRLRHWARSRTTRQGKFTQHRIVKEARCEAGKMCVRSG